MRVAALGVLAVLAVAIEARAEPSAAAIEAERFNEEGKERFRDRNEAEAFDLFRRAHSLDPQPRYLFNLALAAEQLGLCSTALAAYRRYLETTAPTSSPKRSRQAAKTRASALAAECRASEEFANRPGGSGASAVVQPTAHHSTGPIARSRTHDGPATHAQPQSRHRRRRPHGRPRHGHWGLADSRHPFPRRRGLHRGRLHEPGDANRHPRHLDPGGWLGEHDLRDHGGHRSPAPPRSDADARAGSQRGRLECARSLLDRA